VCDKLRTREYKGKELPEGIFYDDKKKKFGYRIKIKDATGEKRDRTKCEFSLQTEAVSARRIALHELKDIKPEPEQVQEPIYDKTFEDVYNKYLEDIAQKRRLSTNKKHDSLWKNHIKPYFGDKKLVEVSAGDMRKYLQQLYDKGDEYNNYKCSYSYGYVVGFIKFFFLIYGLAYDYNWITGDLYNKNFVNRQTKLHMPEMTYEDKEDDKNVVIFSKEELRKLDEILKDSNIYICYMIGLHLGLRISECMGLMWSDVNWDKQTIKITKQLQYQDFCFCLVPPKTDAGNRTLYIPDKLFTYLKQYKEEQDKTKKLKGKGYKATERVLNRLYSEEKEIIGGAFIQRKENGELITINSIKYWTTKIKKENIDFKFHTLRHTCASHLASMNVPKSALMKYMGHKSMAITEQYYLADNELAEEKMRAALNSI
jgi:integrase